MGNSFLQIFLFTFIPVLIALLFRGRIEALLISPLVGLALAQIAGMVHLFFNIPTVVAWLLLIFMSYVVILSSKFLRSLIVENWKSPLATLDYTIVIVWFVFVLGFIWKIPPPLGWDARSIWLFLASWLIEDSQVYVQAAQMSVNSAHPGYPFGVPASIAVAWQLYGGVENLWSGVRLVAFLTLSASLLTVKTLLNYAGTNVTKGYQVLVLLIMTPVLFLVYGGFARNGYMDPLLANLIALASICTFTLIENNSLGSKARTWLLTLTGLSLFCATSVKQEGFWFSLTLVITYVLIDKKSNSRQKLTLLLYPVMSFLIWKAGMEAVGAPKLVDTSGIISNIPEIFEPTSEAWNICGTIINRVFNDYLLVPTPLISIFAFVVLLALLTSGRKLNIRLLVFATFVWFGKWIIIFAPYMLGRTRLNIDAWLASSFDRIMTSQLLFSYIFAAFVFINLTNPQPLDTNESEKSSVSEVNA